MSVPPIRITFMLACYVSPAPWDIVHQRSWDSPAGIETRFWLLAEGLVTPTYEPTERGYRWVEALKATPLPEVVEA